jgi:uncharacterized protein YndB with AHSA1/START domain
MTDTMARAAQAPLQFERRYEHADLRDLWDLWTTRKGFESWWGPQGFRVEVHKLEARVGGELLYDMIAATPEHIEFMKKANMPVSHATRGTFASIAPMQHLQLVHLIDFIPGQEPYENRIRAEFFREERGVRMVVTVEPHPDPHWTRQAGMGFESQLTKVPEALAAAGAARR